MLRSQFDQASAQVGWKCTGAWTTQTARSPIAQDKGQAQRNGE